MDCDSLFETLVKRNGRIGAVSISVIFANLIKKVRNETKQRTRESNCHYLSAAIAAKLHKSTRRHKRLAPVLRSKDKILQNFPSVEVTKKRLTRV